MDKRNKTDYSTHRERVFSAIQPSGELHIGNYLGALKNFIELQDKYDCFFFIADYHSITEDYNPKEKPKQIFNLALDFLAAGLDPKKCTIGIQSQICQHTELAWIFNTITPMGILERMTQYKDKAARQNQNVNVGLFDYPVLQAADILLYKANFVPVGQDQIQHLEFTRDIARLFNNKFGKTFPDPQPILTKTPKIMSLTDPTKKMSKSLGLKSYIGINDPPEVIREKLKKAITLTDLKGLKINTEKLGHIVIEHKKGDVSGEKAAYIITNFNNYLLGNFGTEEHKKYFHRKLIDGDIKFSELKEALAQDITNYFAPFRAKRRGLEVKPEYVKEVLDEGAKCAKKIAKETMKEVKEKLGLL